MSTFASADPRTGQTLATFMETSPERVRQAGEQAAAAFEELRRTTTRQRARMLRAIADQLEGEAPDVIATADRETALGEARLAGEFARTVFQFRMFAEVLEEGCYVEAIIDHARPDAVPPGPDLRRMLVPIGPVAVFAASNFPLAFGVAGGDTSSALAAGCSVVVKAHPSQPMTSQLCFQLMTDALLSVRAPEASVSLVQGASNRVGEDLAQAPEIKAIGFTGSLRGGRALHDLAARRAEPVPVYAEMGSVNPLFVTQVALEERLDDIAAGFVASMNQSAGQFCTKPGLVFVPSSSLGAAFVDAIAAQVASVAPAPMLNARMQAALVTQFGSTLAIPGVECLAGGQSTNGAAVGFPYQPTLLTCDAQTFRSNPALAEEHFGPFAIAVRCAGLSEMVELAGSIQGNLTATIHAGAGEAGSVARLMDALTWKVGRLVWNGYPTGAAVTHAMHHGGPYPATTAALHSAVGSTAIKRFLRPVAFQGIPAELLPPALQEENPLGLLRLVDGEWRR